MKIKRKASAPAELTPEQIADLAVDLWKIAGRAAELDGGRDRVVAACDRAEDRLRKLGFELDSMQSKAYDTNMKVRVVDHEPAEGPLVISACISPAVYFRGKLIREAEVVTAGGEETK